MVHDGVQSIAAKCALALTAIGAHENDLRQCLRDLRVGFAADAVAIAHRIDHEVIRIVHLVAESSSVECAAVTIADIGDAARRQIVHARFTDRYRGPPAFLDRMVSAAVIDEIPVLASLRQLASVPAGSSGDLVLVVARADPSPWPEDDLDALSLAAAAVGQFLHRGRSEARAERRTRIESSLSATFKTLSATTPENASTSLELVFGIVGTLQGLEELRLTWQGATRQPHLPDHAWTAQTETTAADTHESSIVIDGNREVRGRLTARWDPERGGPLGLQTLATLLSEIEARLARQHIESERRAIADALGSTTSELVAATAADIDRTLASILRRYGELLAVDALVLLSVEDVRQRYVRRAAWRRPNLELPDYPELAEFGAHPTLDQVRVTQRIVMSASGDPLPGIPARVQVPAGTEGRVEHILVATCTDDRSCADRRVIEALVQLAAPIANAIGRVDAERHATLAFEHSPVGISITDEHGVVVQVNQRLVELLGVPSAQGVLGRHFTDFLRNPNDRGSWSRTDGAYRTAVDAVAPDGSQWVAQLESHPITLKERTRWLTHVTDITDQEAARAQLVHAAHHDALTELPNRRSLMSAMSAARRSQDNAALIVLDLDRFKVVNDSLGHVSGDELLSVVATRLTAAVAASARAESDALVVRLGGDEFGVYVPGPTTVEVAESVADRLLGALAEPILVNDQSVFSPASVGIAFGPAADPEALLREADLAMYRAKETGGARQVTFDLGMQHSIDERHRIETGLRTAIANGQVEAAFQPEIDLRTGQFVAAEALMRWRRPDGRLIPAAEFVEVAEQTGLIEAIDLRILDLACADAMLWPTVDAPLTLRANLSASQLHRVDLVDRVIEILDRHALPPERLCIEVTESTAMHDPDRSDAALLALHDLGVELAIDDFGTGYSSLAYLKRFPFDTLKIDRSFIKDLERDPDALAFVDSMVSLAASLGLTVVGEGIETAAQARVLLGLGCHRAQGYFYGRPGSSDQLRALLRG
ncbi:MAG: bifunctional diguanylate cyclase/phosphodiesterase [Actinomycetota bacterium]